MTRSEAVETLRNTAQWIDEGSSIFGLDPVKLRAMAAALESNGFTDDGEEGAVPTVTNSPPVLKAVDLPPRSNRP